MGRTSRGVLSSPGLLPYAVLSRAPEKASLLAQVVQELEQITDPREQSNLIAATSILAGLELEQQTIRQLIRSPVMRESTMYQFILGEGRAEGLEQGRTVGERALVFKQLTRKLGILSPSLTAKVNALSLEELEGLGEALLDFTRIEDLETWLG